MGIINVTPDSFSDGGLNYPADAAIAAGLRMIDEGADFLDIGGESTRPGAATVTLEEELRRVMPVVEALCKAGAKVSIDTMKAGVARAALSAGAVIVNDVTSLGDNAMAPLIASTGATVCLMHMQGTPRTMQQNPTYENVVADVRDCLAERAAFAQDCGIPRENIWLDPGIGFGKTAQHNLSLLKHLATLVNLGYPVMIGVSRKSFIGRVLNAENPLPVEDRMEGTLTAQVLAQLNGASIIRTHDVKEARRAMDMATAIRASL